MSVIKMFNGNNTPVLKKGEWASDGDYTYLGLENGTQKVFQGVLDTGIDQSIGGFQYYRDRGREWSMPVRPPHAPPNWEPVGYWSTGKAGILIPAETPFSKIQKLMDSLPRGLKYSRIPEGEEVREWMKLDSLDIYFEDGTYINDLGRSLEIRDIGYRLRFLADTSVFYNDDHNEIKVFFENDEDISIYNSNVFFARIKFTGSSFLGQLLSSTNSDIVMQNCIMKKLTRGNNLYINDKGHNNIDLYSVVLDLDNRDYPHLSIFNNVKTGTKVSVSRCIGINSFYPEYDIKSIAGLLTGGIVIAGQNTDLKIKEKSGLFGAGGIEVIDGIVNNQNANIPSIATINQMIDDKIQFHEENLHGEQQ